MTDTPAKKTPRRPDLVMKVMNKKTDQKSGRIGCGWVNQDGSISFQVDFPFVIQADANLQYMLFPNLGK